MAPHEPTRCIIKENRDHSLGVDQPELMWIPGCVQSHSHGVKFSSESSAGVQANTHGIQFGSESRVGIWSMSLPVLCESLGHRGKSLGHIFG